MHSSGSMYSISAASYPGSSGVGWMQSTGQTSTQELSFVPMHGSAITKAIRFFLWVGLRELYSRDAYCTKHAAANGRDRPGGLHVAAPPARGRHPGALPGAR